MFFSLTVDMHLILNFLIFVAFNSYTQKKN